MAYLRHLFNGATVTVYELGRHTVIGRQADCNIQIDDPTVSGVHAELVCENEKWVLSDKNSTNGVFVKGKKIDETRVNDGLSFTIGAHEFRFAEHLPTDLDKTLKIKKSWIPGVYYTE